MTLCHRPFKLKSPPQSSWKLLRKGAKWHQLDNGNIGSSDFNQVRNKHHRSPFLTKHRLHLLMTTLFVSTEESRGGQLREDTGLGTGALVTHPLHHAQHGAASALLQHPQPSFQQQSHKPVRRTLREPCPLLKLLPQKGHETGEPQSIFQQSQAKNWRDDRKGFSGRSHKILTTTVVPQRRNGNVII